MKLKVNSSVSNTCEITLSPDTPKEVHLFFSYGQLVSLRCGNIFWRTDKFWSQTTSRHINNWLNGADATRVPQEKLEKVLDDYVAN